MEKGKKNDHGWMDDTPPDGNWHPTTVENDQKKRPAGFFSLSCLSSSTNFFSSLDNF